MATNQEEPSTSRLMHEDNLRHHTLNKSDLDTSGAEALVALFKQVEHAVPRGVDVGTSPSPFSFSGSPSEGSRAPSIVPDEPTAHGEGLSRGEPRQGARSYASASTAPSPSKPGARPASAPDAASRGDKAASTGEDSSVYKLLSQKISGTGTFFLLRDDSCAGPRVPRVGEWGRLGEEERGERVKQAYVAAEAICQALVPNESMDLLDALMETTDVYRSRYGYRRLGLEGEASRGAAGGSGGGEGEEEDAVPVLPSNIHDADDILQLTPPFPGVGTVCLHRDKHTRKRRSEFVRLARSQRARVVKTAYEVVLAVAEVFCPGERMALLDRAFELHHGLTGRVHKKVTAALSNGYPDLTGLGLAAQAVGMLGAPTHAHNAATSPVREKAREEGTGAAAQGQSRKRPPPTPTLFAEGPRTGTAGEEEENEDGSGGAGKGAVAKHFKPDLTYPPINPFAAQLMAAHWAVAMSNPHMPFHPSGPSPSSLLSPALPFASPLYQHHMMLAAAAASGNPYFYPHTQLGASSTSTGVSPVSGSWPPMPTADGEVNDHYTAGLDDSCSTFSGFANRDTPSLSGAEGEAAQEALGERQPQQQSGAGKMDARAV